MESTPKILINGVSSWRSQKRSCWSEWETKRYITDARTVVGDGGSHRGLEGTGLRQIRGGPGKGGGALQGQSH